MKAVIFNLLIPCPPSPPFWKVFGFLVNFYPKAYLHLFVIVLHGTQLMRGPNLVLYVCSWKNFENKIEHFSSSSFFFFVLLREETVKLQIM